MTRWTTLGPGDLYERETARREREEAEAMRRHAAGECGAGCEACEDEDKESAA